MHLALDWLGKAWALPVTLPALAVGLFLIPFGARATLGHNAVQFHRCPVGNGALTLGNVIFYTKDSRADHYKSMYGCEEELCVGLHEEAHTYQFQALGLFFFPVYFACGGISAGNRFEQAANEYARGGRWQAW